MPTLSLLQKDATLKTPEERLELRLKHSGKRKRGEGHNSEPEDEDEGSEKDHSQGCGGERALRKRNKRRHKEVRSWVQGTGRTGRKTKQAGWMCDKKFENGEIVLGKHEGWIKLPETFPRSLLLENTSVSQHLSFGKIAGWDSRSQDYSLP